MLSDVGLHLDLKKCKFSVKIVKYLGFIITTRKGVFYDLEKLRAIREWALPTSIRGVRSFLSFTNYYQVFIHDFAKVTLLLTQLMRKGILFQ